MPQAVAAVVSWAAAAATTVAAAVGSTAVALGANWGVALAARVGTYWLLTTASQLALQAGLAYAIDSVSRPKQKPIGSELTFNMDPAYPREMVVGEQLIGGSMVARYSNGSNRKQAHMVIQVADHPCVALNAVYGDNRLQRSTPLTHGVRTEITSFSYSGGPRVWMTWHDGRPGQAADSYLVTQSASDPEVVAGRMPAWTSNHKGAGCAYVYVEIWYDSDILTAIPSWLFQVQGAKFYDRRKDSTAGGSGSHRLDDPSTWEYTTNAAVVWDHWSLGYKVEDDDLAFGLGLSKTELPYAQFANQADLCDEDVLTGTGGSTETIKRYAITGVLSSATFFEDQLEDFQIQMAGRIVDLGGRIGFLGSEEKAIAVSLTDQHLVSGESLQYADKLGFDELYGRVNGNFRDPANLYQATPYQEQVTAYAMLPDGGEAQSVNLDMPLEIHPRRATRLASAWLSRESLQPRLVGVFQPTAWKLEPGDWFEYTDAGLQVDAATFEVIDITKFDDFTVAITARAIDPNFLAFDNDNDPDLSVPPDVPPVDFTLDDPEGTIEAIALAGSGVSEPALRFTLTSIDDMAREVVLEVRKWNGSSVTGDAIIVTAHADEPVTLVRAGILPSQAYVVRIKARAGRRESDWTAYSSPVTTGSTYTVPGSSLASAIVGQGWGATASQAQADNNYTLVPGANAARYSMLEAGSTTGWAVVNSGFGGTPAITRKTSSPAAAAKPALNFNNPTGVNGNAYYGTIGSNYLSSSIYLMPVKNGERVQVAARILELTGSCTGVLSRAIQFDSAGAYVAELTPTAGLTVPVTVSAAGRVGNLATATQDGFIGLFLYAQKASATTAAGGFTCDEMFISKARSGQVDIDPYTPGPGNEPGADVTLTHTAAAIINQGWGATASEAAARATRGRGLVINSRFQVPFTNGSIPPGWGDWVNGATDYTARPSNMGDGYCAVRNGVAGANTGIAQQIGVQASTAYLICAEVRRGSGTLTGAGVLVECFTSGGSPLGSFNIIFATDATTAGGVSASPDAMVRYEKLITTPATCSLINIYAMDHYTSLGSVASANQIYWSELDLIPMTLVSQLRADITASNTAAAITSQGSQATANATYSSSDPGGPNGSWWYDTTNQALKFRVSGAWQVVANFKTTITATASPSSVNEVHTGSSFSSGTITITPAGGTSYTYAVQFVKSGGAGNVTLSATNSASFTATASLSSGQDVAGGIIVTVFDTSGAFVSIRIPLNFTRTD